MSMKIVTLDRRYRFNDTFTHYIELDTEHNFDQILHCVRVLENEWGQQCLHQIATVKGVRLGVLKSSSTHWGWDHSNHLYHRIYVDNDKLLTWLLLHL